MINRRDVIASGVAASFLAHTSAITGAAARISDAGGSARRGPRTPQFVADQRFHEAGEAARAAVDRGAVVRLLEDDTRALTGLYESLDAAWRSAVFPISGLTTRSVFFVIERLAWERGLRTVYRGFHRYGEDGGLMHELLAPRAVLRRVAGWTQPGWPGALACVLVDLANERPDVRPIAPLQTAPGADGTALASWLLVPKDLTGRLVPRSAAGQLVPKDTARLRGGTTRAARA